MSVDPLGIAITALQRIYDIDVHPEATDIADDALTAVSEFPNPRRMSDGPQSQGWFYPDPDRTP